MEIFCFETGKWRELVIPSPRRIDYFRLGRICFACNGKLYWTGNDKGSLVVLGLDPFKDCNSTVSSFIVFDDEIDHDCAVRCLGVYGGRMLMCGCFDHVRDTLYVWELKERDQDLTVDRGEKLCLSECIVYCLDLYRNAHRVSMLGFDPNNKDIWYMRADRDVVMCNMRTRQRLKMKGKFTLNSFSFYQYALPWWPTPVPRLPQHAQDQVARGGGGGATSN